MKSESFWHVALIVAVASIVMLVGLGNTHLWDQDEGYYASAAAEMYARGDAVVPMFNGEMFGHKPPMMYWGMMAGFEMFGVNELGARFVSAILGAITCVVIYGIAKKLYDAPTGLVAGLAMASSLMFSVASRSATADTHLTLFVSLAFYFWIGDAFRNAREPVRAPYAIRWSTWGLTYAMMGLAVLTKGPIGLLFPMAVIGLFMLTQIPIRVSAQSSLVSKVLRNIEPYAPIAFVKTVWRMRPLTGLLVVAVIAGPWYWLVQNATSGKFLEEFIGVHHMGRFSHAMDNHSGPFFYYILACLIGMYPWSAFIVPTCMLWVRQLRDSQSARATVFVSCWAGVYLVIFSVASTKLPNYVLPAYPALAIMVARYVAMWVTAPQMIHRGWLQTGWVLLSVVGLLLLIGFPAAGTVGWEGKTLLDRLKIDPAIQTTFRWLGVIGLPLLVGGLVGWLMVLRNRAVGAIYTFAVTAASMLVIFWQFVAPAIDRFQTPQLIAREVSQSSEYRNSTVAVVGYFRPSMVFYLGRPIVFCTDQDQAIAVSNANESLVLIAPQEHYEQMKARMQKEMDVVQRVAKFPQQGELLILREQSLRR